MGENAYCTWDDKVVAQIEAKYKRKLRAMDERYTNRWNKMQEKVRAYERDMHSKREDLRQARRDEIEAICVPK